MNNKRIVYLDTETTGLDPKAGDRIIELAMIEVIDNDIKRSFCTRFDPDGKFIDPEATVVHGILNEDLIGEPHFSDLADEIQDFIRGSTVVAHHLPFDQGFLDSEFERSGMKEVQLSILALSMIDTRMEAKELGFSRLKLDALCDHFGVDRSGRNKHGALIDVMLLLQIHNHLLNF